MSFVIITMKLPKLGPVRVNSVLVNVGGSTVRGAVSNIGSKQLIRLGNNLNTKLLNYKIGNANVFKIF